jgi:hypothetical protein
MNTYKAFYNQRTLTVHADTMLNAQRQVAQELKAKKPWQVAIVLAKVGEREVAVSTASL